MPLCINHLMGQYLSFRNPHSQTPFSRLPPDLLFSFHTVQICLKCTAAIYWRKHLSHPAFIIRYHVQEAAFIETVRQYQEGHSMGIRHLLQASPVSETDAVKSVFHSWFIQARKTSWAVYSHTETTADVQSGKLKLLHRIKEKEGQHERNNRNSRTSAKKIFFTAAIPAVNGSWCSGTLSVEIHWNRCLLNRKQFPPDGWKLAAQNIFYHRKLGNCWPCGKKWTEINITFHQKPGNF